MESVAAPSAVAPPVAAPLAPTGASADKATTAAKADSAILAALERHGVGEAPAKVEPAAETNGKAPAKAAAQAVDAEAAPKVETEGAPAVETEENDEPGVIGYGQALDALRKLIPQSAIDHMTRRDILKRGRAEVKRANDFHEASNERAALKKQIELATKTEATDKKTAPLAEPTVASDFKSLAQPLVKAFESLGGEGPDVERALEAYAKGLTAPLVKQFEASQRASEARVEQLTGALDSLIADGARKQLLEQFPQLKDDDAFGEVVEAVGERLAIGKGKYGLKDIPKLMAREAAYIFRDEIEAERDKAKAITNRKRDAGQPTVENRQTPNPAKSKDMQVDEQIRAVIERHGYVGT